MKITKKKILGYAQIYTSYKKPIILNDVVSLICRNLYVRCPEKKQLIEDILTEKYKEYEVRALLEDKEFTPTQYMYAADSSYFTWAGIDSGTPF